MFSDVGEAFARRRRDLTIMTFFCFEISSFVSPFLNLSSKSVPFGQSSRTLSNSGTYINRGRIQRLTSLDLTQISFVILSLNPTTSVSPQTSAAYLQTLEQFIVDTSIGSKSGLTQAPPSPPHRFSLMARVSLGPSDALFSVGTSTAHDEYQSWQVVLCGSSPTIISVQGGGADPFPPTEPILGFGWMGLISNCGPVTLTWPMCESCREVHTSSNFQALYKFVDSSPLLSKSRSAPLIAFSSLLLKVYCSIKNGRRRRSIFVTISLDETCFYKSWNLMDRVAWLSSDASLNLKLIGLVLHLSNHRWCDLDHAFALLCEHIPSINCSSIKLNHPATSLMGDASQHSRIIWKKPPRYDRSICFSSFFKPDYHLLDSNGRGLHSNLLSSSEFWPCDSFWRIHQTYSFKEIPLLKPYFDIGNQTPPVASSMEQFIESSYASFARAIYDHKLIGDFSKLVFKHEFLQVSKDFSTFASFLKWCILENSLNLYLYLSRNAVISICMNLPPLRI